MTTHSSFLAWKIPWTEATVRRALQSCKELQRLKLLSMHTCTNGLHTESPYDEPILPLGVSGEMKTHVHTKVYMWMFTAALFTAAKKKKTISGISIQWNITQPIKGMNY